MKIRYRHHTKPDEVRIIDSVRDRDLSMRFGRSVGLDYSPTQKQHDSFLLGSFEENKRKGIILWYEVVKEESA